MAKVTLLFRIDIGLDTQRGFGAVVYDVTRERQKGIRGNSMEQIASRVRNLLIEETQKQRDFPAESEPSRIITPNNGF